MTQCYQDADYPHFDYELQTPDLLPRTKIRGPVPDLRRPYFTCIGAAQTFGRFCKHPFPNLLSATLRLPVLNLGLGGAGPKAFLAGEMLKLINSSELAVIQVLSGRSEGNSAFDNKLSGGLFGTRLRDGKRMRFETFLEEEMKTSPREHVASLIAETRQNWIAGYKTLLERIVVPKVLFYISTSSPDRTDDYAHFWNLLGPFPQLVNRRMIDEIRPLSDAYVELVSKAGLPQKLWPSTEKVLGAELQEGRVTNLYYPTPEMHAQAARGLEPACRELLVRQMAPSD